MKLDLLFVPKRFWPAFILGCLFVQPLLAAEAPWVGHTFEDIPCTGKHQGYGPFDYTNPVYREKQLAIVERYHFTPNVEQLISGESSHELGGDIGYTLNAFPNHHRALMAMARYQIKKKRARDASYAPTECYFQRAIAFKPDDGAIHLLYGIYLHKLRKHSIALQHYQLAEKSIPNNIEMHYNMGLLYFDLQQYKKAYQHAVRAYERGYPLLSLKKKLTKLGYWKMPTE